MNLCAASLWGRGAAALWARLAPGHACSASPLQSMVWQKCRTWVASAVLTT